MAPGGPSTGGLPTPKRLPLVPALKVRRRSLQQSRRSLSLVRRRSLKQLRRSLSLVRRSRLLLRRRKR
jgi:hypothetical protein